MHPFPYTLHSAKCHSSHSAPHPSCLQTPPSTCPFVIPLHHLMPSTQHHTSSASDLEGADTPANSPLSDYMVTSCLIPFKVLTLDQGQIQPMHRFSQMNYRLIYEARSLSVMSKPTLQSLNNPSPMSNMHFPSLRTQFHCISYTSNYVHVTIKLCCILV